LYLCRIADHLFPFGFDLSTFGFKIKALILFLLVEILALVRDQSFLHLKMQDCNGSFGAFSFISTLSCILSQLLSVLKALGFVSPREITIVPVQLG
jgi:hypothetical protein